MNTIKITSGASEYIVKKELVSFPRITTETKGHSHYVTEVRKVTVRKWFGKTTVDKEERIPYFITYTTRRISFNYGDDWVSLEVTEEQLAKFGKEMELDQ